MDELVLDAYAMTRRTSADGWDDLPAAMRGAVLRAALRIVQGVHTASGEGFDHSLRAALGTLAEYRYYLYLARRLGLIDLRRYRAACARHERVQKCLREMLAPAGRGTTADPAGATKPDDGRPAPWDVEHEAGPQGPAP
jgi:four helix bundle protein